MASMEENFFKRYQADIRQLSDFGFQKKENFYLYQQNLMNGDFRAEIMVSLDGRITGRIFDLTLQEEYPNFRIETLDGAFVRNVREEYLQILSKIRQSCFHKKYFIGNQANRIARTIFEKYQIEPEFLWKKMDGYGVFRNSENQKWFAIIMNIDFSKISTESGEIEIINLKVSSDQIEQLLKKKGFYNAYHMNKQNWISIVLDDTIEDDEILRWVEESYRLIDVFENIKKR